ncbi:MAG: hypothetical protein PHP22_04130 [Oscillospiraceae bacterium]|jgi:hypothetical protein|nr:hypothetical protein [Oscillospiraceae bacterium]
MNCKNCGCNYSSSDPQCPHCGTKNPKGEFWLLRISAARAEYENNLRNHGTSPQLLVLDRVIGRVIIGLIILTVCLLVGSYAYFPISDKVQERKNEKKKEQNISTLEQLYSEGRYGEIHAIIDEYNLKKSKYDEYKHIGSINFGYENFSVQRFAFVQERDTQISEYTADHLVISMNDLLRRQFHDSDFTEKNRENLEAFRTEVRDFAVNMLGFSETQVELLSADDLKQEDRDALAAFIVNGGNAQ